MKHIFVTGGVVSSLGKGLAAAALGCILEPPGLRTVLQKFDPYLNVDPGTMSPFQHGEVYVLNDGTEADLDLGHYERFTDSLLTKRNSLTSGQVYLSVIEKERAGDYLGATVQVVPHITDAIKQRIHDVEAENPGAAVLITEIGGTTGDIEGLPFLEAIRQFILERGPTNAIVMHVTLVPYITAAGELKTKPSQQSVAKLREIGLQPQVLICRTEHPLDAPIRQKLSTYCNVPQKAVIEMRDVPKSIYEAPLMLQREGLDGVVCELLRLEDAPPAATADYEKFVRRVVAPRRHVKVGFVGKYTDLQDAYKSVYESLTHAGAAHDCRVETVLVASEDLEAGPEAAERLLGDVSGVLVPGGFGERGIEGMVAAARYAREQKIPYLGLCLGMQVATIEFGRNVCGLSGANSVEFDPKTPHPVITLLETQKKVSKKGATMRLGVSCAVLAPDTLTAQIYGRPEVSERHRHRYEFNMKYREAFESNGFRISGTSPDGILVELIELRGHPYFVACQFHPEFQSKPNHPHPLFRSFVGACLGHGQGG